MNNLTELYQDLILDHSRHPKNYGTLLSFSHHAEGINPICGDEITLFLKIDQDKIENVTFTGTGCAISLACASLMTEALKGKSIEEAKALFLKFHELMTMPEVLESSDLGKLNVFENVKNYPMRIKCATLPWHTLKAALEKQGHIITTEVNNDE